MKNIIIALVVIVIAGAGLYLVVKGLPGQTPVTNEEPIVATSTLDTNATTTVDVNAPEVVIGQSVEGRDIMAYRFGTGPKEIVFVGGLHGGYEWNTALVAYELRDYLEQNPTAVPTGVKVTVIPVVNPDGLNKVVSSADGNWGASDVTASAATQVTGRFNANLVDLNRNFDCDWQKTGTWQSKSVSGGSAAFSEPESLAIKNYIEANNPTAVIVWYSAAGGVFASSCHNGVSDETNKLTKLYADASGYPAHQEFNFYEITGDMVNWLAKENVPAISVLLTNHTDTEWSKNWKGIEAVLKSYAE